VTYGDVGRLDYGNALDQTELVIRGLGLPPGSTALQEASQRHASSEPDGETDEHQPASHEGAKMAPFFFAATHTRARSGRMAPIAEEDV